MVRTESYWMNGWLDDIYGYVVTLARIMQAGAYASSSLFTNRESNQKHPLQQFFLKISLNCTHLPILKVDSSPEF